MKNNALGLIEVKGYLGAIAVADSALKAADVSCSGVEVIRGGLVTVKLSGEVGAIQAAVDAGAETATQLNVLLTKHVIPRVHEETAALVANPIHKSTSLEQQFTKGKNNKADSNTVKVKQEAVTANTKTRKSKSDASKVTTNKPVTGTSKPSTNRTGKKSEPENETAVTFPQAEPQLASQSMEMKSSLDSVILADKSSKNTKKASSS